MDGVDLVMEQSVSLSFTPVLVIRFVCQMRQNVILEADAN